ncbi:hypothetical protein EDB19DRAFT_984570 [Suillus lakei]|nr:hypothetical protein EDB19DRAFT_984570 [Suillus lakei]
MQVIYCFQLRNIVSTVSDNHRTSLDAATAYASSSQTSHVSSISLSAFRSYRRVVLSQDPPIIRRPSGKWDMDPILLLQPPHAFEHLTQEHFASRLIVSSSAREIHIESSCYQEASNDRKGMAIQRKHCCRPCPCARAIIFTFLMLPCGPFMTLPTFIKLSSKEFSRHDYISTSTTSSKEWTILTPQSCLTRTL